VTRRDGLFHQMALMTKSVCEPERLALLSLSDSGGYACLVAVQAWCSCDSEKAQSILLGLYLKGFLIEGSDEKLFQPQMILARANARTLPIEIKYKIQSGNISRVRRQAIYERDGNLCVYCDENNHRLLTLDHVIPKCAGGLTTDENLVTCCKACNQDKADTTLSDFMEARAASRDNVVQEYGIMAVEISENTLEFRHPD
jgi:hypothetical protein